MIRFLVVILILTSSLFGLEENDTTVEETVLLTPYEQVLSGVVLLKDFSNFSDEEKVKYYSELLSFAGISHGDFQKYLNEHRSSSEAWFKTMKRINDSINK